MDHYKTLRLHKGATQKEIKDAYRIAVREHHPDKGGSPVIFHQIQEAYETIGDPQKRLIYDEASNKRPVESLRSAMDALVEDFFSKCKINTK